jgi:hypothetical protein
MVLALTGGAHAADAGSVTDNVKQLVREINDPGTPGRIKAHEQTLEKKVKSKRERQRKDHAAKPADAVDLAKSLDKPAPKPAQAAPPAPAPPKK